MTTKARNPLGPVVAAYLFGTAPLYELHKAMEKHKEDLRLARSRQTMARASRSIPTRTPS